MCLYACGYVFIDENTTFAYTWIVSVLIIHAFVTIKFWILKTSTVALVVLLLFFFFIHSPSSISFEKIN